MTLFTNRMVKAMVFESQQTVGPSGTAPQTEKSASASTMAGCLLSLFARWQDQAERRRSYERINEHLMRDIGMTPVDMTVLALKAGMR